MAYVTGPLHSVTARGQFAKTLIFQTYKNRSYAKRYRVPNNRRLPGQVGIRAMVYWVTKLWATLSPEDRASWAAHPNPNNLSLFNLYFTHNMARWNNTQGPMTALQTAPEAAYEPAIALTAIGGDGKVDLTIAPATIARHVDVTALTPAPVPDCTGKYFYLEEHTDLPAYRRVVPTPFRIFSNPDRYHIHPADNYTLDANRWDSDLGNVLAANYTHYGSVAGHAACTADIPAGPDAPAAAVAIFRDDATIVTPDRRIARAVLTLDGNGEATWTDTDQVGGKAGPAGGLAAGNYHYTALPLSLDGRVGTPTADALATVT